MSNMIISEGCHEVVAVVVVGLHPQLHVFVYACLLCGFYEIFRQELSLVIEIISRSLHKS